LDSSRAIQERKKKSEAKVDEACNQGGQGSSDDLPEIPEEYEDDEKPDLDRLAFKSEFETHKSRMAEDKLSQRS
jgi:hypothetical protein